MRTDDFDFSLPDDLIAQFPAERRDASRMLVVDRLSRQVSHRQFRDIGDHLCAGDVLVLNNSRVIPARLRGVNAKSGGRFEVLLLEENALNDWWVMLRPGKRAPIGTRILIQDHSGAPTEVIAEVKAINDEGHRRLFFARASQPEVPGPPEPAVLISKDPEKSQPTLPKKVATSCEVTTERREWNILDALDELGEMPLPPYIERAAGRTSDADFERYQTVFAKAAGSVAAPTAGLHFTPELLEDLRAKGVQVCFVTLHVGLGTFAPVKAESITEHVMHEERYEVSSSTAEAINAAKREGRRVVAVGTTSVRVLESAVADNTRHAIQPGLGRTRIFIYPPRHFQIVDALLTNFHLPRSTLLMLVSAFASPGTLDGRELILRAYAEAVRERYRFFSYGDAMFIQ